MYRMLAVVTMAFAVMAACVGADDASLEDGMLCVSKCGTCPVICTQSPPPPSPSQTYIIPGSPPPSPLKSHPPPSPLPPPPPPPPPSPKSSPSKPSPPAGNQPHGGLSYPYYYFYTADASHLLVGMSCLSSILLAVYFVNLA